MSGRLAGSSVVEALIALLLGLLVVHLGLSALVRVRGSHESILTRFDALASGRVARTVLRGELRRGVAGEDWTVTTDSLRLRAFRGAGFVCSGGGAPGEVVVAYRGDRLPEPAKDSIEVTTHAGSVEHLDLVGRGTAPGPCPGADSSETVLRLTALDTVPPGTLLVRIFETGSYHFEGGALRYRVGNGGRQPLTPEVWQGPSTGFLPVDSTVRMRWTPVHPTARTVSEFLSWAPR